MFAVTFYAKNRIKVAIKNLLGELGVNCIKEHMNEEVLAKSLLEKRESGVSVLGGLLSIRGRIIYRLALLGILYFLYMQSGNSSMLYLGIGYVVGMTIQDISWFSTISKSWPFSKKVTDWSKVEELANKNS